MPDLAHRRSLPRLLWVALAVLALSSARNPAAQSPEHEEVLALPEGAWLAMRKSGGLLFNSREVAVYGDGRVTGGAIGGGRAQRDGPCPRRAG